MKKVRKGQIIKTLNQGGSQNKEVYEFLLSLKVGDQVTIDREDWRGVTPFNHTVHNSRSLKGKFTVKQLADHSGWLVIKIK